MAATEVKKLGWGTESMLECQKSMQKMFDESFALEARPTKPFKEATKEEVCEALKEHDLQSRKGMEKMCGEIPHIPGTKFTVYESGTDSLICDVTVYEPENRGDDALPGIIHIHGGAFYIFTGKENFFAAGCEMQALHGSVVMSIHYSQVYEQQFPGQINEVLAAVRWFGSKREEFNMVRDAGFLVMGESAGGCLTILTALHLKEAGELDLVACMNPQCPCFFPWAAHPEDVGAIPKEIADAHFAYTPETTPEMYPYYNDPLTTYVVYLRSNGTKDLKNPMCWPWWATDEQLEGLPPIYLEYNECDSLSAETRTMITRLDKAGVKIKAICHTGTFHGGDGMQMEFDFMPVVRHAFAKKFCVALAPKKEEESKEEN